jgi:hypothetical protein
MSVNDASRIVIDDYNVTLQIVASLTDDYKGITYARNRLLSQFIQFQNDIIILSKDGRKLNFLS